MIIDETDMTLKQAAITFDSNDGLNGLYFARHAPILHCLYATCEPSVQSFVKECFYIKTNEIVHPTLIKLAEDKDPFKFAFKSAKSKEEIMTMAAQELANTKSEKDGEDPKPQIVFLLGTDT